MLNNLTCFQVGILVAPDAKSHLRGSLLDFFFTYKQVRINYKVFKHETQ
jgi:hypothetical protein